MWPLHNICLLEKWVQNNQVYEFHPNCQENWEDLSSEVSCCDLYVLKGGAGSFVEGDCGGRWMEMVPRVQLVVTWCMWGLSGQQSVLGRVGGGDGTWYSKCGAGGWRWGGNWGSRLWFWALLLAVGSQEHPRTSELWVYFTTVGTLISPLRTLTPTNHEIYLIFKLSLYGLMEWRACTNTTAQFTVSPGRPGKVMTPVLLGCPKLW